MGILMPRERIRTVACYCATAGEWTQVDNGIRKDLRADMKTDEADDAYLGDIMKTTNGGDDEATAAGLLPRTRDDDDVMETAGPMVEERSRVIMEERSDEEDVFGHGGSLGDGSVEDEGLAARRGDEGSRAAAPSGSGGERSQPEASTARPVVTANCSRRGVKSIREVSAHGSASAAIDRMMAGSRPSGIDAAAKLREIRRRVMSRCRGEVAATGAISDDGAATIVGEGARTIPEEREAADGDEGDQGMRNVRRRVTEPSSGRRSGSSEGTVAYDDQSTGHQVEMEHVGSGTRCEAAVDIEGSMNENVLAINAKSTNSTRVNAAREGPGDPSPSRSTESVTQPSLASVADTVAGGVVVATLAADDYARIGEPDRGKATFGPPRGAAAPREDNKDTSGELQGHDFSTTSLEKPLAAGGGRPQRRRECASPQELPASLGAGPSEPGRELYDDEGGGPARQEFARRRDGGVEPETRAVAARGSGGAATASTREMPSEGMRRRVQGARTHECHNIEQSTMEHQSMYDSSSSSSGNGIGNASRSFELVGSTGDIGRGTVSRRTTDADASAGGKGNGAVSEDPCHRRATEDGRPKENDGRPPKRVRFVTRQGEEMNEGEDTCGDPARTTFGAPEAPTQLTTEAEDCGDRIRRDNVTARVQDDEWASTKADVADRGRRGAPTSVGRPGQGDHGAQTSPQKDEASTGSTAAAQPQPRPLHGRKRPACPPPPRGPRDDVAVDVCAEVYLRCYPINKREGSHGSDGAGTLRETCDAAARGPRGAGRLWVARGAAHGGGGDPGAADGGHGADGARAGGREGTKGRSWLRGNSNSPIGERDTAVGCPLDEDGAAGQVGSVVKRRRIRGKQPPRDLDRQAGAYAIPAVAGRADGHCGRRAQNVQNSMQEDYSGQSGGPSRSPTLTSHRCAHVDRDGHELAARARGVTSWLEGAAAQRGEGYDESRRGRGRPPDGVGRPAASSSGAALG